MITTNQCEFDKETGNMYLDAMLLDFESFPRELEIKSTHTGKIMKFEPITPDHPRYDEDGWDGEMALYVPCEPCNVKMLTISYMS